MAIDSTTYYRSVADADAYFANQLYAEDWTGATDSDKEKALLMATRSIDALKYDGEKKTVYDELLVNTDATAAELKAAGDAQFLEFPRDATTLSEQWLITLDATGGTFDLVLNGETASAIAWDATAAAVQTALEGLASITSGDLTVTGSDGGPYTVALAGTLALTVGNTLTTVATSLTGGGGTAIVTTVQDATPDEIFYAVCEEAKLILAGKDPEQEFANLVLTSDGVGSNRVSSDRSQSPPLHTSHLICSAKAWRYVQPYLADTNFFNHIRD